jgi:RNA-directed DNA polymerase
VISPLLANLYFRRFLLAWQLHGHQQLLDAHIVNYADDFVICCPPGKAEPAMARMQVLMARLGLEVNTTKTRIVRLPEETFNFSAIPSAASTERMVVAISAPASRRISRPI